MADDKGAAAVVAADDELPDDEAGFEAPERGSADELLDAGAHAPIDAMRHSTAHVMAEAVLDLFPGAKLGIGPAIDDGFYYDFELPRPLTPDDLERDRGADAPRASRPTTRSSARSSRSTRRRAIVEREGQDFKVEILDDLAAKAEAAGEPAPVTTFYEHGPFHDLCRGPHVESTGKIGPFKLLAVSGAYWRGDQARASMQRIYGTVWETQEELDQYLWRREEAKKRDHRRAGRAARPVQLPRRRARRRRSGTRRAGGLYQTLRGAMRELQDRRGYEEIYTPPLVHQKLWEQSGHWDLYRDNMFLVDVEGQTFSLKPMNCPESTFVYRSPAAVLPRPAAAPVRVRRAAPQRALGRAVRPHARAPLRDRRRPHLRATGPDRRRRSRRSWARSARRTAGSAWCPR